MSQGLADVTKTTAAACSLQSCEGCEIQDKLLCTRCYNLSCPINRVPEHVRAIFFAHYPEYAQAWHNDFVDDAGERKIK